MAQSLFTAFFPATCRLCTCPLSSVSRLPVCDQCLANVQPLDTSLCCVCGDALPAIPAGTIERRCTTCTEEPPAFEKAFAYGIYSGELRGLIHLLKYNSIAPAAKPLGRWLAEAIRKRASLFEQPAVLIPVPLHRERRRTRGFNQAERIAHSAMRGLRDLPIEIAKDVLVRTRPTDSQTGFTREQRRRNLRGAFKVTDPARIASKTVLLVDDVLTTGATADECARVLRRAGAEKVLAVTVGRAVSHQERRAGFVESGTEELVAG